MKSNFGHHLKSIAIFNLFGRYSYKLPATGESLDTLSIIYGENGAGKTTLLNLVFHLLSPASNRGHRSKIASTPFSTLEVILIDGTKLTATKDSQLLTGPVLFTIEPPVGRKVQWRFIPGNTEGSLNIEDIPASIDVKKLPPDIRKHVIYTLEKRRFFEEIGKLQINTLLLTADRLLLGDKIEETSKLEIPRDRARSRNQVAEIVRDYRVAAVKDALQNASMWLHRKFLEQSYAGSISSDPYQDVVNKIAQSSYKTRSGLKKSQQDAIIYSLKNTILELDRKSKTFAEYGLKDASVSLDLISTIENTQGNKLNLIDAILQPYLDGLTAHFENLTPIYNLTNRFIGTINEFLKGKKLTYSVRDGIKIVVSARGKSTEIDPQQLSSGEQQLILLFCYVLVFQDSSSVIFIDEPEISLNVLWQRILITSLQNLSKDANIQFVFASHSIEILSKHRNRVISMEES